MDPRSYLPTIERHREKFKLGDKKFMDRVLDHFQGRAWVNSLAESESQIQKTSTNLVFAITETALSSLVPRNPQVTALPRNKDDLDGIEAMEGVVNLAFDAGRYRKEMSYAVQNTVLFGRGVYKTTWDATADLPVVRSLDLRGVFYDLVAQRPQDIRYWCEATLLSKAQVRARMKEGKYDRRALDAPNEAFPTWLLPNDKNYDVKTLRDYQNWTVVWEVYDIEDGRVVHMVEGDPEPVFQDDLLYNPYDLLTFNYNGEDCRGLSEIGLILSNQEEYNWLQTYLLAVQRHQIPRIGYDASATEGEGVAKALNQVPLGGFAPLRVAGNKRVGELFTLFPMAQPGNVAVDLLARLRENISFVSALADAQRGQSVNARTATELLFIQSAIKNRLSTRQDALDEVTEQVAAKSYALARRFMQKDKVRTLTGHRFQTIEAEKLLAPELRFNIVPYSAMEPNKGAMAEILRSLIEYLSANPNIDQRRLTEYIVSLMDAPSDIVLSPEGAAVAAQAAAGAPPPPVVPPGPPPPGVGAPGAPVAGLDIAAPPEAQGTVNLANASAPGGL